MLLGERVRDDRGGIVLRQKHQTLAQLLEAGLISPEQRRRLLVVVGVRDPYELVFTASSRGGRHDSELKTPAAREIVAATCRREIERVGYGFEGS